MSDPKMVPELSGEAQSYYDLITDHGNAIKHYYYALQKAQNPNTDKKILALKRILFCIEKKIRVICDTYTAAEIQKSLQGILNETQQPLPLTDDQDKPPSSPNDSESSNFDEQENGTNAGEHSSASSEISMNDKENNVDKEAEEKAAEAEREEAERREKDDFLASFGLIHKDKVEELQNRKIVRKCRANANPQYSRTALETKKQVQETMKMQSKRRREDRELDRKEKAKNTVCNFGGIDSKQVKIKFDHSHDKTNSVLSTVRFRKIKSLKLNAFSCLLCRYAINHRDRKVVLACEDCKTLYHQLCIAPDNDLGNLKCRVCSHIVQRDVDHRQAIQDHPLFKEVYSLSQNIIQQLNHQTLLSRSNTALKRRLEDNMDTGY